MKTRSRHWAQGKHNKGKRILNIPKLESHLKLRFYKKSDLLGSEQTLPLFKVPKVSYLLSDVSSNSESILSRKKI